MSDSAVVELRDASRVYNPGENAVWAMNHVDLVVQQGEFLALVGPSGSGKSTVLNTIGCLDTLTSGSVNIDGVDATAMDPKQRGRLRREKVGFIFQSFNLIPVLTAFENIAFSLELQSVPHDEIRSRVMALLTRLGIGGLADRRPKQLSGGQQQRVAIGRALIKRPAIVLADEPTANLDRATSTEIIQLMQQINREERATFVFSTHDEHLIRNVKRVVRLEDGRIVEDTMNGADLGVSAP